MSTSFKPGQRVRDGDGRYYDVTGVDLATGNVTVGQGLRRLTFSKEEAERVFTRVVHTVLDHYRGLAVQAVEEWDGQDTADLFVDILRRTDEGTGVLTRALTMMRENVCQPPNL